MNPVYVTGPVGAAYCDGSWRHSSRSRRADAFDVSKNSFTPPSPKNLEEVHAALEQSVRGVEETSQRNLR